MHRLFVVFNSVLLKFYESTYIRNLVTYESRCAYKIFDNINETNNNPFAKPFFILKKYWFELKFFNPVRIAISMIF